MKRLALLLLVMSLLVPLASAMELLTNGDFELVLTEGWQQETSGGATFINRATTYDPDADYEVLVRKSTGTGYARVVQVVPLPSTDATLQASLKIAATATSTAWSGAALRIDYLDQDGFPLGETIIGAQSTYCPWADGPTTHIIPVVDSNWKDYSLDLNDELTNLPGVDPPQIRQVRIALVAYAQDC